ncbi:cell division protein FtsA [Ligilactobacillus agilis]|uniref:Cell division protein FtsA n=1 Tax=Ligilactobacillus agilis TaxID=1601 RepID=A0A222W4D9_9LACO|nr:cell division protein FtsA [Ligilactobacillus agilis]ASR41015.1 cell division protein FtsA [Ligilactobacillus agilis]MBM6763416.1 cell division protein FtsA [Ligilactobacillus agilis]MCI5761044.1 cell division protein FtsA [Ligilactobacillus agilis]MDM8280447.1 cell division protein FtsA [Ligilactobacillus agilis]NJE32880.1 cell division protein FtsA [Ligilactobacillus agilis]
MDNSGLYVGLDIGTTSIKVIIAEYVKGQLNIIGSGNTLSAGLNRGVIVDIDQVVDAIKDAVKQAEDKAGVDITDVIVGLPANMLQIEKCQGMISIGDDANRAKEITDEDVQRVTEAALVQNLPPERDVIDIAPDEFVVDDFEGIRDPRGMVGVRLEMKGVMYTGPKTILYNTKKCVERAGLRVQEIVVAPIATAQLALDEGEKDFGAIVIDLGGGQTTAAVVHDHKLKYTYVDQEGGDFVTRDISVVLNTSVENAESLKRNYGLALASGASSEETFAVQVVGKQEPRMVTEEFLAQIIQARLEQIFGKIAQALGKVGALDLPGGIILTGGMADLPGIAELAEEIFGVNVRIFRSNEMGLRIPSYTQVLGLVTYVALQNEVALVVKHTIDKKLGTSNVNAYKNEQVKDRQAEVQSEELDDYEEAADYPNEEKKGGFFSKIKNMMAGLFDED